MAKTTDSGRICRDARSPSEASHLDNAGAWRRCGPLHYAGNVKGQRRGIQLYALRCPAVESCVECGPEDSGSLRVEPRGGGSEWEAVAGNKKLKDYISLTRFRAALRFAMWNGRLVPDFNEA